MSAVEPDKLSISGYYRGDGSCESLDVRLNVDFGPDVLAQVIERVFAPHAAAIVTAVTDGDDEGAPDARATVVFPRPKDIEEPHTHTGTLFGARARKAES